MLSFLSYFVQLLRLRLSSNLNSSGILIGPCLIWSAVFGPIFRERRREEVRGGGQCSSGQSVSHRKNEQHEINMKRRRSPLDAASYAASAHCQTDKVLVPNSNHSPSLFPINHHLHTQNTTKIKQKRKQSKKKTFGRKCSDRNYYKWIWGRMWIWNE